MYTIHSIKVDKIKQFRQCNKIYNKTFMNKLNYYSYFHVLKEFFFEFSREVLLHDMFLYKQTLLLFVLNKKFINNPDGL